MKHLGLNPSEKIRFTSGDECCMVSGETFSLMIAH